MKKQKRWIKSIVETAAKETTAMPWQRGSRRTLLANQRRAKWVNEKTA